MFLSTWNLEILLARVIHIFNQNMKFLDQPRRKKKRNDWHMDKGVEGGGFRWRWWELRGVGNWEDNFNSTLWEAVN